VGDKIIKINGKNLKSYKDVFDYYKKVKKREIDYIRLGILRNNKEKEIEYQIF